jgi:hypothetical protein
MRIIGCDYHPGFQQIGFVDTETGECGERRLQHREEAEKFYRDLAAQGMKVRVRLPPRSHAPIAAVATCKTWSKLLRLNDSGRVFCLA